MYAIIDVETTGGKRDEEALIEIAIFRYDGHKVVDEFCSLVNPEKPILLYVQRLTRINAELLCFEPRFDSVAERITVITEGAILVGHNVAFDYYVLKLEFERLGIPFERDIIDTLDLSKKFFPGQASYSLGKLCRSIDIHLTNRHRALGDARATLELFRRLLQKDEKREFFLFRPNE
ncbi:MAG: PolC-type DNA polymerase III [Flavobacteriales bacterium AspAUS03]